MSRIQTRRSISISHELYDRIRTWCDANDMAMSGLVEHVLTDLPGERRKTKRERWAAWAAGDEP